MVTFIPASHIGLYVHVFQTQNFWYFWLSVELRAHWDGCLGAYIKMVPKR